MEIFYEAHNIGGERPYIYHTCDCGSASHWHENVEILQFFRSGNIICDGNNIAVPPGGFAIISSEAVHSVNWQTKAFYNCFIADSAFLLKNGIDVRRLEFEPCVCDEKLTALYERLSSELENEDGFFEAGTKAAMLNLMVYLCRRYSRDRTSDSGGNPNIKKAIVYINSNVSKRMTIDEIASYAALSKYYFCREFKKATGYSVVQYINIIRCRTAEKMLSSGEFTVSEAAEAMGYDNLSYFTRTFKSIIGRLPGEYKKSVRN